MDLPPELHLEIRGNLEFPEYLCLKYVSSYFNRLIKPMNLAQLRQAELSSICINKGVLVCSACLRLRNRSDFSDDMKKGRSADDRVCIDCGVRDQRKGYSSGEMINWSGLRHIICNKCPEFGSASPRKLAGECKKCWKRSARTKEDRWGARDDIDVRDSRRFHHAIICRSCYKDLETCPLVQACLRYVNRSKLCRKCLLVTAGCCPRSYHTSKLGPTGSLY